MFFVSLLVLSLFYVFSDCFSINNLLTYLILTSSNIVTLYTSYKKLTTVSRHFLSPSLCAIVITHFTSKYSRNSQIHSFLKIN